MWFPLALCRLVCLLTVFSCAGGSIPVGREHTGNIRDTSHFQSHHAGSSVKSIDVVSVDSSGRVDRSQIMKQQLATELQLPLRDLRLIDPSFPSQIQAAFAARPNAILFTLENIKVVVKSSEALVFGHADQAGIADFVPALQQQITSIRNSDNTMSKKSMRFEHIVIEAALNVVCTNLLKQVRSLSPAISLALQSLQAESKGLDIIKTQADQLLPLKNQLDELRKRVKEIDRAIKEVLDNDEDMLMMHLGLQSEHTVHDQETVQPNPTDTDADAGVINHPTVSERSSQTAAVEPDDNLPSGSAADPPADTQYWGRHRGFVSRALVHARLPNRTHHITSKHRNSKGPPSLLLRHIQEDATISFEMMLENYLNEIGWIASEVEELLDQIINTEENAALQIDLLRNRILRFELALSMSGFIVSCAALVTGLFGMNLLSHVELQPVMFWAVAAALSVGMLTSWSQLWKYGKKERLF